MPARVENVTMDCRDERRLAQFWSEALGYEVKTHAPGDWLALSTNDPLFPRLSFEVVPEPKIVKNRVHLDLVPTTGLLEDEIQRLERLGARRVRYVENDPDESHWIMADPEGNEFVVRGLRGKRDRTSLCKQNTNWPALGSTCSRCDYYSRHEPCITRL